MANEWVGILDTLAPKYLKGASDLTIRKRLALAMLERRGRITYNHTGYNLIWTVQHMEPPVESYADGGQIDFTRHDLWKRAEIDWRGYRATDMMTEKEKDMLGDDVAIVNRYTQILPNLSGAVRNKIGTELYIDGYAAGNENRLCGAGSWAGTTTTVALDLCGQPDDSYAGIDTDLAQYGSWSAALAATAAGVPGRGQNSLATDWPEGTGDSGYDFWSPKLVNHHSSGWVGTDVSTQRPWAYTCEKVLRRTIQWLSLTAGTDGPSLLCLMAGDMMTAFKDTMSAKQQIVVPHKESEDLGFPTVLNFEGMALQTEYGVTGGTAWVFNMDKLELCSLKPELLGRIGPDWDPRSASWLFQVGVFANLKFDSPKYFAKIADLDSD